MISDNDWIIHIGEMAASLRKGAGDRFPQARGGTESLSLIMYTNQGETDQKLYIRLEV